MSKSKRITAAATESGEPLAAAAATPPVIVDVAVSRCTACGSTNRLGYHHTAITEQGGLTPDGQVYERIVRRYCRCADCGQTRIDRSYETGPRSAAAEPGDVAGRAN
jgi:hypothetical protein